MDDLMRIGDVAELLQISARTLRYYEEAGLIRSSRPAHNRYRYYDSAALLQLRKVTALRRLDFSTAEIRKLLCEGAAQAETEAIIRRKLADVDDQLRNAGMRREILLKLLAGCGQPELLPGCAAELEAVVSAPAANGRIISAAAKEKKEYAVMEKMTQNEVRIINLPPQRVAAFLATSATPEADSWKMLQAALPDVLISGWPQRYFGFNNPGPQPGKTEYGYESWITLPESSEFSANSGIVTKDFPGGKYAVATASPQNIGERWQLLAAWVAQNGYRLAAHQWLEEVLNPADFGNDSMQLDLYCPIAE